MKMFYEAPMGCNDIQTLLDKYNVRETIEFERYCRDYGHFKEERAKFHDDAFVWASWFKGDADGFVAASSAKGKTPAKHRLNDVLVWLNKDRAICEAICTITFRTKLGDELVDLDSYMRLHYRLERREDGIWKICHQQGIHEKDTLRSAFNDGKWAPPREEVQKYRPCFWNMMYRLHTYQHDGGNAQDNSAGEDIPETVQSLYEASSKWFYYET